MSPQCSVRFTTPGCPEWPPEGGSQPFSLRNTSPPLGGDGGQAAGVGGLVWRQIWLVGLLGRCAGGLVGLAGVLARAIGFDYYYSYYY